MVLRLPDREPLPLFKALGAHVEIDSEACEAHCVLDISEVVLNRQGVLHGGVTATLLDTASGITASLTGDDQGLTPFVTLSLNVSYVAAATKGKVRATGRITGGGKGTKFVSCELRDEGNRLIAASTGVFKRVQPRKTEGVQG